MIIYNVKIIVIVSDIIFFLKLVLLLIIDVLMVRL